ESQLEGERRGVAARLDRWTFANRRRRDCLELGVVCSRNSERSVKSLGRERRGAFRVAPAIEDDGAELGTTATGNVKAQAKCNRIAMGGLHVSRLLRNNCRGGPPWPPVAGKDRLFLGTGGHGGPPLQLFLWFGNRFWLL